MKLTINGEMRETPALANIAELATWLELPAFGSAVELNGAVIRKAPSLLPFGVYSCGEQAPLFLSR